MPPGKTKVEPETRSPAPGAAAKTATQPDKQSTPGHAQAAQRAADAPVPPPNGMRPAATVRLQPAGSNNVGRARTARALQQTMGNAHLSRLLNSVVQAKLTVNMPGDAHEQEADRVADEAMRMPEAAGTAEPPAETTVQRQAASGEPPEVSPGVETHINSSQGGGQPLPDSVRDKMASRFGQDFREVRVHAGAGAARAARELNARAFTTGRDIHFGQGQYQPETEQGGRLLAHELTHVVQQGRGLQRKLIQRQPQDEPAKYADVDYKRARRNNLSSWYTQYKFFDLFREEGVYPGSHPVGYANHVYELQLKLEKIAEGTWMAPDPGILEPDITADSTLIRLSQAAEKQHNDPATNLGISKVKLERIHKYFAAFEQSVPPFVTRYFQGVPQLEAVNRNKYFYIRLGDRGEYVGRLQMALADLGYDLGSDLKKDKKSSKKTVSGVFGSGTKKAVIKFQADAGLAGKDVDGIVGQTTLRLLDKYTQSPVSPRESVAGGTAHAFDVPVLASDLSAGEEPLKQEFLKRALKVAFPVTDAQVDVLLRSQLTLTLYRKLTQDDVDLGHVKIEIGDSVYNSIMAKVEEVKGGKAGPPVEEKLTGLTLDVLKTAKLPALNEKIEKAEKAYNALLADTIRRRIDPAGYLKDVETQRAEIEQLKKERQQELDRLGLTLDQYEKLKTDFIHTFEKFAVKIAFRMLAENEIQANIEARHYKNKTEVTALKAILGDLAAKYSQSEKLWWEAVSLTDSAGTNPGKYKNGGEYRSKNTVTTRMGKERDTVFVGNEKHFYTEANVRDKYKALEEKPSPYFAPWKATEKDVVTTLQKSTDKFPILAYQKLELRREASQYAAKSDDDLQKMLLDILEGDKGIKENIAATRKDLAEDPEKIWELPVVVARAQQELGATEGPPADLIKAKQEAVADKGFWKSIGMAILGIGLGLLALVSGPVGWLALAASIGVGAYDAYSTYKEITFKKETAGTAIDPASALGTDDPSYFWFWVSLVSIGLDVFQAAKVVKSIGKGIQLADDVSKGLREARAAAELRLAEAGEATAKGKEIAQEIADIDEALTKVSTKDFIENYKVLKPLKGNPIALTVMSEALRDKKIVRAVTALGKMVEKEVFENALKFYAGIGRKSLDELPELLRLIEEGGLKANKRLIAELLSDPRAQRALLDTADAKMMAREFEAWEAAVKAGKSQSFIQYLEAQNLTTRLAHDARLVDMFGEAFATLPNVVKNRQILQTVEPRLLEALNKKALSPEIARGLEVLLNSDVLAESSRLASAQERLLRELKILGSQLETPSDFAKVAGLLDNPASRRALWEGATQLAGRQEYLEIIAKAAGGKLPAPDVMDDLIRIGPMTDPDTVEALIKEPALRKALAKYPEAVAVLKKCASPCLPTFVSPEQVAEVAKLMAGKSTDDVRRIREFLYLNRGTKPEFDLALTRLKTDYVEALKDVAVPALKKPAKLAVAPEVLAGIEQHLPVSVINKIMARASAVSNGAAIITDLRRVLDLAKGVKLQNFDTLIKGLAEGSSAEFRAARHLLDEAERFVAAAGSFKYGGLQKADALLSRFTLTELNTMMNSRWTGGFVNTLYDVAEKLGGEPSSKVMDLIKRASRHGGAGDLGRLNEILTFLKKPTATYDEAVKAIESADAFAANVAKAMSDPKTGRDALIKLLWGESVKVEDGVIKATETIGKSGSDAYQTVFQLGKGESVAKSIAGGGALSTEKWKVFREVIEKSDIATGIKNNIIGEMWTRVHVQYYESLGYTVTREVRLTAANVTAKADLVLVKGKKVIVVECKSGAGVYSEGQEVIYGLLKKGQYKSVMLEGDQTLAKLFAESEPGFVVRHESEIVPPK